MPASSGDHLSKRLASRCRTRSVEANSHLLLPERRAVWLNSHMGLSSKLAAPDVDLHWSQELLENGGLEIPKPTNQARNNQQQRQHWPPLKCPRCSSTNTKFCYYNNYSRTQPRYLCKACKRHWTEGGTLRNVPVGGARKNKRTKHPPDAATATSTAASSAGAVYKMNTSNLSIPLDLAHQQGQQNKFPFLFGGDQYRSSSNNIFPEILRPILLRSPPTTMPQLQLAPSDYTFTSLFSSDPNVAPKFTPAASAMDPIDGFGINNSNSNNNPSFGISSSYSCTLPSAPDECVATINTCSTDQPVGTWQVGPMRALPTTTTRGLDDSSADYWCGWEDDMTGRS